MTVQIKITDCNHDWETVVTGTDKADALRLAYEALVDFNRPADTLADAVAAGSVSAPGATRPQMIYLDRDPEAFWAALVGYVATDNQDYNYV